MVTGRFLSANVGTAHPSAKAFLFGLNDPARAALIHQKISEIAPDIAVFQETWNFAPILLGDAYEFLGNNHTIAVKREFGQILPGTFRSHATHFKKSDRDPVLPAKDDQEGLARQLEQLRQAPYDGQMDSPYGIPADFDVASAIIETHGGDRLLVGNVHVVSAPWNDVQRAKQLREWVVGDCIPRANADCQGHLLLAGDFNDDEVRRSNAESAAAIQEILALPGMQDAAMTNREVTTNYPRPIHNWRYDHLLGTASFSEYRVQQSLTDPDLEALRKQHRVTWWMWLDHKNVSAEFKF